MSTYKKSSGVQGAWAKAIELTNVKKAKIVSETNPMPSQFTNKDGSPKVQDVCKVRFEGKDEPLNVSLNRATIDGLVDAFGEESAKWQGHVLNVETEKIRVAGKNVVTLYLVPEGYEKIDDENGYARIVSKMGTKSKDAAETMPPLENVNDVDEEETKVEEIPF